MSTNNDYTPHFADESDGEFYVDPFDIPKSVHHPLIHRVRFLDKSGWGRSLERSPSDCPELLRKLDRTLEKLAVVVERLGEIR